MHTFTNQPPLKPGYWWWNVADLGQSPKWEQRPMPVADDNKLFGYDEKQFMARQYRAA